MSRRTQVPAEKGSSYLASSNIARLNCSSRKSNDANFYVKETLGFNMLDLNLKYLNISV